MGSGQCGRRRSIIIKEMAAGRFPMLQWAAHTRAPEGSPHPCSVGSTNWTLVNFFKDMTLEVGVLLGIWGKEGKQGGSYNHFIARAMKHIRNDVNKST